MELELQKSTFDEINYTFQVINIHYSSLYAQHLNRANIFELSWTKLVTQSY
jgi:hypothetical protein